ncbi:MAG: hypothetical protein ABWZ02_10985 [Nakamurella sp.]
MTETLLPTTPTAAYPADYGAKRSGWGGMRLLTGGSPTEGNAMGLDDLVNKAKDLMGQGAEKAEDAKAEAQAGNTDAAAASAAESSSLIDKAKELLTDERIDQVAGAIKSKTPDNIDSIVDQVATKGKEFNN